MSRVIEPKVSKTRMMHIPGRGYSRVRSRILPKRYVLLILGLFFTLIFIYVWSPTIIQSLNPQENIIINGVTYPDRAYRTTTLPVMVEVVNKGAAAKDILIELSSLENPALSNWTRLEHSGSVGKVVIHIPFQRLGRQAFTVRAYWVGPGGICRIQKGSRDGEFVALGAEYDIFYAPRTASISEDFHLSVIIINKGTAAAEKLIVQVIERGRLSVYLPDTQVLNNFQAGETRRIDFTFAVPHDAQEGNCTLKLNLTTSYPIDSETLSKDLVINLQKSPMLISMENSAFLANLTIASAVTIVSALSAFSLLMGRMRRR